MFYAHAMYRLTSAFKISVDTLLLTSTLGREHFLWVSSQELCMPIIKSRDLGKYAHALASFYDCVLHCMLDSASTISAATYDVEKV